MQIYNGFDVLYSFELLYATNPEIHTLLCLELLGQNGANFLPTVLRCQNH